MTHPDTEPTESEESEAQPESDTSETTELAQRDTDTASDTDTAAAAPTKKRKLHWSLEVTLFLAVFAGVQWWTTKDVVSGEAPNIIGYDLTGQGMSLKNLRDKPTIVHFWATWCGVCSTMDDNIESLAKDYQVVTIATNSGSPAEVIKWMKANGMWDEKTGPTIKVLVDNPGRIAQAYGVTSFPSTFFIGKDGKIDFREVGYTTTLGLKARAAMTR